MTTPSWTRRLTKFCRCCERKRPAFSKTTAVGQSGILKGSLRSSSSGVVWQNSRRRGALGALLSRRSCPSSRRNRGSGPRDGARTAANCRLRERGADRGDGQEVQRQRSRGRSLLGGVSCQPPHNASAPPEGREDAGSHAQAAAGTAVSCVTASLRKRGLRRISIPLPVAPLRIP